MGCHWLNRDESHVKNVKHIFNQSGKNKKILVIIINDDFNNENN